MSREIRDEPALSLQGQERRADNRSPDIQRPGCKHVTISSGGDLHETRTL